MRMSVLAGIAALLAGCSGAGLGGANFGSFYDGTIQRGYVQDARQIDLAAATEHPAAQAVARLLDWTAPARAAHDLGEPAFGPLNGAQRQRRALDGGADLGEVYAAAVRETQSTYSDQEATTT